jgi:hypothetical protein
MRSILAASAVTAAMLVAVACARTNDDRRPAEATITAAALTPKASCDTVSTMATCSEYRAGTTFGLERSICDSHKGKFATTACPTSGRLARCEMPGGEVKRYYRQLNVADAKTDCESELVRGTFVEE